MDAGNEAQESGENGETKIDYFNAHIIEHEGSIMCALK